MESTVNNQMLELMLQPVFTVRDGVIDYANQAALLRQVSVGQPITPLLGAGLEEYAAFREGCLYLPMTISGVVCNATILWIENRQLVLLDPEETDAELQALALAAREIREPLNRIMAVSETLFSTVERNPEVHDMICSMNRGFYQLLRLAGNMADAGRRSAALIELRDVASVFHEIFEEATELCQRAGVTLTFTNLPTSVYSLLDHTRMERAIYNLLSNALKFTPPGGLISARLEQRKNTLYLTISDTGSGISFRTASRIFTRYCREPGIEDSRHGIGLGMSLVRAAAAAHGGTVLLDQNREGGTRITISIPIRQDTDHLHSPVMRIDYAGERSHGLIELSDVLPNEMYDPEND